MDKKGTQKVLDNVTFNIRENETVSIMGKSGEGKSTIARILCGTIKPDSGRIQYNGEALLTIKEITTEDCTRIQLIPQQPFRRSIPSREWAMPLQSPCCITGWQKTKRMPPVRLKITGTGMAGRRNSKALPFPDFRRAGSAHTIARALALKRGFNRRRIHLDAGCLGTGADNQYL